METYERIRELSRELVVLAGPAGAVAAVGHELERTAPFEKEDLNKVAVARLAKKLLRSI